MGITITNTALQSGPETRRWPELELPRAVGGASFCLVTKGTTFPSRGQHRKGIWCQKSVRTFEDREGMEYDIGGVLSGVG